MLLVSCLLEGFFREMPPLTGCAYYPEQWTEDRWALDAQLMRAAGLSVVRLAEFTWDKLEPQDDRFDFAWLERAIDTLANAGLKIVLCTPTSTPPPWLTYLHPEVCRVGEDGVRISPGGRRHACANVPVYLENSAQIVDQLTQHFGKHPALIGWQIDNEFGGGETTRCYCSFCKMRFRLWLEERYGTLDKLNQAWGTQFWGMTYHSWEHIPTPAITTEPQSPAMRLDYRRFSSDSWVRFLKLQNEIVRHNSPGRWITHNFMLRHWSLDYWKLAEDLDFVSYNNYPHGLKGSTEVALNLDLMYALKQKPFWVMEQQPGPVNWHPYNPPVPAGQVRLWSHQAIAHGAEAVVYFPFRAGRTGQEQYHRGLLKWDASQDQAYHEAQQVSGELSVLPKLHRPQASVGIFFDYEDLWAIELEPHNSLFSYWSLVYELYEVYWRQNIAVDFLRKGARLDGYQTVIMPSAVLRKPEDLAHWETWVARGGRLILMFRNSVREISNISTEMPLPGGLTDLIGARVTGFMNVPPDTYTDWQNHRTGKLTRSTSNTPFPYKIWAETLETDTAEPLLHYADGMLADKIAATRRKIGTGEIIYLGCWVENFSALLDAHKWMPENPIGLGVLAGNDDSEWQVQMNHTDFGVNYEHLR